MRSAHALVKLELHRLTRFRGSVLARMAMLGEGDASSNLRSPMMTSARRSFCQAPVGQCQLRRGAHRRHTLLLRSRSTAMSRSEASPRRWRAAGVFSLFSRGRKRSTTTAEGKRQSQRECRGATLQQLTICDGHLERDGAGTLAPTLRAIAPRPPLPRKALGPKVSTPNHPLMLLALLPSLRVIICAR